MRSVRNQTALGCLAFLLTVGEATPADAYPISSGVVLESVNVYSGPDDLPNSIANSQGFMNMLPTSLFSQTVHWQNSQVWDSDFVDPDWGPVGSDASNFDQPGQAISFFTGHGVPPSTTTQYCTTSATCTSPPMNSFPGAEGTCTAQPDLSTYEGYCTYDSARFLVTNGSSKSFNDLVGYRAWVAFGESSQASWAGYGTNGGTNAVFLDLSWGAMANFGWNQLGPMFAGIRIAGTIQPVAGDTSNVPDRGAAFAVFAAINPASSPFDAWADALNLLSPTLGTNCGPLLLFLGGGHGINGCGCSLVVAADSTETRATAIRSQSWEDLRDDALDPQGAGSYTFRTVCNYDAAAYPWRL